MYNNQRRPRNNPSITPIVLGIGVVAIIALLGSKNKATIEAQQQRYQMITASCDMAAKRQAAEEIIYAVEAGNLSWKDVGFSKEDLEKALADAEAKVSKQ